MILWNSNKDQSAYCSSLEEQLNVPEDLRLKNLLTEKQQHKEWENCFDTEREKIAAVLIYYYTLLQNMTQLAYFQW